MPRKLFDTIINDGDFCSFCGARAKSRSRHTGNYSCEISALKCPAVRVKNSKGLSKAHKEGRMAINPFGEHRAWSKGKNILTDPRVARTFNLDDIFCKDSKVRRAYVKELIIKNGLKPYECTECNIVNEWNGKPISLHLDHINGINNDHRIENLRFLCPNCHAQTSTYCGKNKNPGKKVVGTNTFLETLKSCNWNIHQTLQKLNLPACRHYYDKARKLKLQNEEKNLFNF